MTNNSDIVYSCLITGLVISALALITTASIYEERLDNIEYEISFMKLDLSCDNTPIENILSNYLLPLKHDELIEGVNNWYLENCV